MSRLSEVARQKVKGKSKRLVLATAAVVLAGAAAADAGQGAIASGVVAATSIESSTKASFAGAVGYRFNHAIGLEVEVTSVPTLKPDVAGLGQPTILLSTESTFVATATSVPTSLLSATGGRATVFTTNVRVEMPTTTARVIPYVAGGGGVANVKERFTFTVPTPRVLAGAPIPMIPIIPPQPVERSSTNLALTLGGGVSVLVVDHVSVDVDLRYLRLIGVRDLNVGRFGVGASYRF